MDSLSSFAEFKKIPVGVSIFNKDMDSIPATFVNVSTTGNFLGILKKIYSLFQPGAAFRKETSYLIFRVNQMIDSCTKCNTWLKWLDTAVFHKHLQKTASITLILVPPFNAIVSKNIL